MPLTQLRRIAVLRLSAMGDCILLQPTLLRILEHHPDVEIDWYIDNTWVSIFAKTTRLNMITIEKPRSIRDYRALRRMIRQTQYDVVLAMQASFRSNILYSFFKAPLKIGFDKRRARDGQWLWTNQRIRPAEEHLLDGFMAFAQALKVPMGPLKWHLSVPDVLDLPQSLRVAIQLQRPIIGIVPAASKLERTPYAHFWSEFINKLSTRWVEQSLLGIAGQIEQPLIVMLGGPSQLEQVLSQEVLDNVHPGGDILNLVGKTSLFRLSGILKVLQCLVSPDSGPAHLADAHGTPVIGLYGVAPSRLSGPYHYQDLVFDVYDDAVRSILRQDPKTVRWGTRVHDRQAMALIDPEQVVTRVCRVLKTQVRQET